MRSHLRIGLSFAILPTLGLVALALAWHGRPVLRGGWERALGWEFEQVAVELSQGHGYTFGSSAWLGPYEDPYHPTAWVEPVQTGIMAVAFRTFGGKGRLALVLMNYFLFALSCTVVFELGRRIHGPAAGFLAAVALAAFSPGKTQLYMYVGNTALATALLTLTALGLFLILESPSLRKSAALGALLGVLALTHAGTLLFAPFVAGLLILVGKKTGSRRSYAHGALLLLVVVTVVLPWTARNWVAFGEFVPVRTGLGQNMHYALPALAQTVRPEIRLGAAWTPPPWTAQDAREAMSNILETEQWGSLLGHSLEAGRASGPEDYERLNEAQRDAVFLQQSLSFIFAYPAMAARLAAAKFQGFFWSNWREYQGVTLMALLGVGYMVKRRRAWPILALILLYLVPYLLSAPIYYRYRAPIEPLLFLLASLPIGALGERLWVRLGWTRAGRSSRLMPVTRMF